MAKFVITGVKEIDKALKAFAPKVAKKILRTSLRKALKPMHAAVRTATPRRSGALAKAVKIKAGPRKKNRIELDVRIGEGSFKGRTFYGAMVELGTKKQEAQHFMKKTFETHKTSTRELAIVEIKKAIKETTAELRTKT